MGKHTFGPQQNQVRIGLGPCAKTRAPRAYFTIAPKVPKTRAIKADKLFLSVRL